MFKSTSSITIRAVCLLVCCLFGALLAAPTVAEAQDWRAALKAERARNAQRIQAIDEQAAPLGHQLNAVVAAIVQHNDHPPDPYNGAAVDAYNAEAARQNAERERLVSILIPLRDESDALIARNQEIDAKLTCPHRPFPCSSDEDCECGDVCGDLSGQLGAFQVCQPSGD